MKQHPKKFKHVNDEEFETVKTLLRLGVPTSGVAKTTGRSVATVSFMKRAQDLEGYRRIVSGYLKKRTPSNGVHFETNVSKASKNRTIVALLERIAISLEKLEKCWEPKRGIFNI